MATELIVYPQAYDGVPSVISSNINEYIVDGVNFLTVNASSSYENGSPHLIYLNQYPTIANTWYRGRVDWFSPLPDYPAAVSNNLVFDSNPPFSETLIYQRVTNLTAGQAYNLYVNVDSVTGVSGGALQIFAYTAPGAYPLTQIGLASSTPTSPGLYTAAFTAPATSGVDLIISLQYTFNGTSTATVSYVSLLPSSETPTFSTSDGQVICDLYEDEEIPLTLSVDNFKNVAEQIQSYSKGFNIPGTKKNNRIFENLFEITRSAQNNLTFNPYAKTRCALKQDGFILFEGYLRVIDIQDKEGEISYNINLYSEVIALADFLQDKTFSELDFSELDHAYQYTNIKNSWNDSGTGITYTNSGTSGYRNAFSTMKYPFVDWEHSYSFDLSSNYPELPTLESSFRPFINIKYLIQRIFAATNKFSYTSDFIDNDADFGKLYMDFNWGSGRTPIIFNETGTLTLIADVSLTSSFATIDFYPSIFPTTLTTLPSGFGYASGVFTASANNQVYDVSYDIKFFHNIVPGSYEVEWLHTYTGGTQIINPDSGGWTGLGGFGYYQGNFIITMQAGDTLLMRAKETLGSVRIEGSSILYNDLLTVATNANETTSDSLLQTLRGELDQWEFLKGIMTMFNLISMPDNQNPDNIIIEPYKDIFLPSPAYPTTKNFFDVYTSELDWTYKIDISQIKLTPLTDLNKRTSFKFVEDDDDYAFNVYKNSVNGHLYGSLLFDATTTTGGFESVLDGEEEIIAEPFAATIPKALMSQFPDFITPAIYSYSDSDGTSEGFENSPRIMYNNGIKTLTSCTYNVPDQNGVSGNTVEDDFLQFSHLTSIPTVVNNPPLASDTQDFHFGICQLFGSLGVPTPKNLFGIYWLPYYNELYDPDTRIMSIKVNLTAGDMNTFKFYDTVFIKNRKFRVNKIDYKPGDLATVEFILIP